MATSNPSPWWHPDRRRSQLCRPKSIHVGWFHRCGEYRAYAWTAATASLFQPIGLDRNATRVLTGAEMFTGPSHDDDFHIIVVLRLLQLGVKQLVHIGHKHGVAAMRTIESDLADMRLDDFIENAVLQSSSASTLVDVSFAVSSALAGVSPFCLPFFIIVPLLQRGEWPCGGVPGSNLIVI